MLLKNLIRTIPDYPKPGIQFRDLSTLLEDPAGLRSAIEGLVEHHRSDEIDLVAGIEARGFLVGPAVASRLDTGFVMLRKPGKLPGPTVGRDFELEYGSDRIEMRVGAIEPGRRVLIIDDLIATGGTAKAAVDLVRDEGGIVVGCSFIVSLPDLGGAAKLVADSCRVHALCEFDGD